jgi:hypothetical protein
LEGTRGKKSEGNSSALVGVIKKAIRSKGQVA